MIIIRKNGREYQIDEADQARILELAISNGGDLLEAVKQQFEEKFKEKCGGDSWHMQN